MQAASKRRVQSEAASRIEALKQTVVRLEGIVDAERSVVALCAEGRALQQLEGERWNAVEQLLQLIDECYEQRSSAQARVETLARLIGAQEPEALRALACSESMSALVTPSAAHAC
jgi:hypothetical protein